MDANGTKFHLLLGKADWGRATPDARDWARLTPRPLPSLDEVFDASAEDAELAGLRWDRERNELTLAPKLFRFSPSAKDRRPRLSDRRGAGADRYGNRYWIAESEQEILVQSIGSGTTTHFWSADDCSADEPESRFGVFGPRDPAPERRAIRLRGLAVTEDHYLVAGVLEPAGLLIFDLHAGGAPIEMVWPDEIDFTPFDFSPRPAGGLWILDRDLNDPGKPPRFWALDRHFNVEMRAGSEEVLAEPLREVFQPLLGAERTRPGRTFARGITLEAASPLDTLDAIAIEALPDGTVLILDRAAETGFSVIYRYGLEGQLGDSVSSAKMRALIEEDDREEFTLIAHDFAFIGEHITSGKTILDRLYLVDEKGNQSFAFNILLINGQIEIDPLPAYLPMRLFGGKGLVSAGDHAFYDFSDGWIPLTEQLRPRFELDAALETPDLDGGEPDCKWHRLMLDAFIPPEAKVEVWSRAANEKQALRFSEWRPEPSLYRRGDGSEQPYVSPSRAAANGGSVSECTTLEYRTRELLLQRARGRFVQLKLRLSANGRTTPRLRAMRVYYPRFSYLDHYLPSVYREDEQSAFFLDRFLANIEGFFTSIEDEIAAVQMLFDVRSIPAEYLDWLAGWFGVVLDPAWDEGKRRLFISHAMDFFQYRGTIHGLKAALRLAFDRCADDSIFDVRKYFDPRRDSIRIIESYRSRRTPGVVLGDTTSIGLQTGVGLAQVSQAGKWQPRNGRSDLDGRYAAFLSTRFAASDLPSIVFFPLRDYEWQRLTTQGSSEGLTPINEPNDVVLWRAFLAKRYPTIEALNLAHDAEFVTFDMVSLPANLLPASTALDDWNAFVAEKSSAWRDFALQTLGLVPRSLGRERTLWRDLLTSRYDSIAELNAAYGGAYSTFENVPLPHDAPPEGDPGVDWDEFKRATAGTTASANRARWQDFLARRYRRVGALNEAYNTAWTGFDDIALFDELPLSEAALADWFQFESVVLAMQAAAHRFTVLLPAPGNRTGAQTHFQQQRELAARIVNWEKPAHTVFDVKFYWSMFRVEGARLGYDTLLDFGSRAPELLSPMVLGQGYLAEAYLEGNGDLSRRQVLDSSRLGPRRRNEPAAAY